MNCYVCIARPCVIFRYHWKLAVKKGKWEEDVSRKHWPHYLNLF